MKNYRVITNGISFKVQKRCFLFFWVTERGGSDEDNKIFEHDLIFKTKQEALEYIDLQIIPEWRVS